MRSPAPSGRAGETPPQLTHEGRAGARLFVAVDIGDALRAEVARVVGAISAKVEAVKTPPRITWVKPAALHVTIRFLGEVAEAEIQPLVALLSPPIPMAPFDVAWRGLGAFPSHRHPRAIWMGVINGGAQLGQIEAEVSRRLHGTIALPAEPLLPHLTLGRIKMSGAGVDWPKIFQAVDVRGIRSAVDRVTLYRSHLSQRGPHYTELVSAPLRADE